MCLLRGLPSVCLDISFPNCSREVVLESFVPAPDQRTSIRDVLEDTPMDRLQTICVPKWIPRIFGGQIGALAGSHWAKRLFGYVLYALQAMDLGTLMGLMGVSGLARLYLLVEAWRDLWYPPPGAYDTVNWTSLLPLVI